MGRILRLASAAVMVTTLGAIGPAPAKQDQALLVSTPSGFKLAFKHAKPDGSMMIMEFVPEGQTVETWRQMITIQHFPKLADADPLQLAGNWTQRILATCPKAQASRLEQSPVNGHPAVRVYIHTPECGARPPESILALVIKGHDAMHMIQHAWRPKPPTHEQLKVAMGDFDRARLCSASDTTCVK